MIVEMSPGMVAGRDSIVVRSHSRRDQQYFAPTSRHRDVIRIDTHRIKYEPSLKYTYTDPILSIFQHCSLFAPTRFPIQWKGIVKK
jgi:hypothetical protein